MGASGAVGREIVSTLERRNFPIKSLSLFASARSAGTVMNFRGKEVKVLEYTYDRASGHDIVFLAASASFALENGPALAEAGAFVVDNSRAFRMDPSVPLVVPEVNPTAMTRGIHNLIANPNCTTAIASVVLAPIHAAFGLSRVIMSTYQAASGAGAEGMTELVDGAAAHLAGEDVKSRVFAHPLPFNVIPAIDVFTASGYTREEEKVCAISSSRGVEESWCTLFRSWSIDGWKECSCTFI